MNSLKKKFGQFAVSAEKMAMVNGGTYGTWTCWDRSGKTTSFKVQQEAIQAFTMEGGYDGCSSDDPEITLVNE